MVCLELQRFACGALRGVAWRRRALKILSPFPSFPARVPAFGAAAATAARRARYAHLKLQGLCFSLWRRGT
jgi:hypothetical protein